MNLEEAAYQRYLKGKKNARMKIASCTEETKKVSEIYFRIMGFDSNNLLLNDVED